ncbi:MAG TPA: hypothetical protein VFP17_02195 [Solirubrobacterales bacterium]|nr:hypothetical protein [Solirubrobacterales bacterium]
MPKKTLAICASLVAFAAFAIAPALASAATTVTENGVAVKAGEKIVATSPLITLTTPAGNVTCTTGTLTGTLHQNEKGLIKGTISTALFGGTGGEGANKEPRCTSTVPFNPQFEVAVQNLHYCIENEPGTDKFLITAKTCTEEKAPRTLKFTLTSALTGGCTYEAAQVTGEFTTNVTPATLSVEKQGFTKTAGGGLCPETGELKGTWSLETDTSPFTGLTISP